MIPLALAGLGALMLANPLGGKKAAASRKRLKARTTKSYVRALRVVRRRHPWALTMPVLSPSHSPSQAVWQRHAKVSRRWSKARWSKAKAKQYDILWRRAKPHTNPQASRASKLRYLSKHHWQRPYATDAAARKNGYAPLTTRELHSMLRECGVDPHTLQRKNPLGRCSTCGRPHVDPMTLNSWPIDKSMCYQAETGGDPRCKPRKGKKRRKNPRRSIYVGLKKALAAKGFKTFKFVDAEDESVDPEISLGNGLSLALDNAGWPTGVVYITEKPEWTMYDRIWQDDPSLPEIANRVEAFAKKHGLIGVCRNPVIKSSYRLADGSLVSAPQLKRMFMGKIPSPAQRRLLGITLVRDSR